VPSEVLQEAAGKPGGLRLQARGESMAPLLRDGEAVLVRPVPPELIGRGDVVLFVADGGYLMHRVIGSAAGGRLLMTKGDALPWADPPVEASALVGRVVARQAGGGWVALQPRFLGRLAARFSALGERLGRRYLGLAPEAGRRAPSPAERLWRVVLCGPAMLLGRLSRLVARSPHDVAGPAKRRRVPGHSNQR
jgi:hypothetical protein